MFPEIATLLLGTCVGAVAVVYAGSKGYLGHRKTKAAKSSDTYAPTTEQAKEVPPAVAPAAAKPAPPPTAIYETVQPAPAPTTYSAPPTASVGAPTLAKKPTRTYRRRTAPIRSTSGVKKSPTKPKKR